MTGQGGGDPQQADQRAGHQQGERDPAGLAGGDLRPEAGRDLAGVAEFGGRGRGGLGRGQAGRLVRVGGVQQAGTKFSHDAGLSPGRAGQPRRHVGEIGPDHGAGPRIRQAGPVHGTLTADGAGVRRADMAAEKSRQVLRSASSDRRPAGVSW